MTDRQAGLAGTPNNAQNTAPDGAQAPAGPIRVWDLPTRLFHWLLAASFAGDWLTAEDEGLRVLHYALGCTAAALVVFRIAWGFAGTRYARFSSLDFRPGSALRYLRSLASPAPEHHTGHNPAASWAIAALLALVAATALTGWLAAGAGEGGARQDWHEAIATATLSLVVLHVVAVVASSLVHRENLVRSMLTGNKRAAAGAEPAPGRAWAAALLAASLVVLWTAAPWSSLPVDGEAGAESAQRGESGGDGDD